jgi:hypothetical protein
MLINQKEFLALSIGMLEAQTISLTYILDFNKKR